MVIPGQTTRGPAILADAPAGPYRTHVGTSDASDEDIDNMYNSRRSHELDEAEIFGPASRRTAARKRQPSTRHASSAPDPIEAIKRSLPPLSPEDEVEVGLSSDRAPALLEEGGVLSADLRVSALPMPPSFEGKVFSTTEVFEDEEEEYDTEDAFNALDGPLPVVLPEKLVHARRSWVPAQPRRGVRPGGAPSEARPVINPVVSVVNEPPKPEPGYRPLVTASIASIALSAIAIVSRPIPMPQSIELRLGAGSILTDSASRQATGYLLVILSVFSLVLSLRKRWRRFQWFDFAFFRVIHAILGTSALVVLGIHTGLRLGHGFNLALAIDFLAVCVLGGVAGIVTAVSYRWDGMTARDRRVLSTRVHLFAFWPLPVLVALHIFQIYYY